MAATNTENRISGEVLHAFLTIICSNPHPSGHNEDTTSRLATLSICRYRVYLKLGVAQIILKAYS